MRILPVPKIIVTDSSERSSLAIIRSLGKRKMDITATDSIAINAGFLSKYTRNRILYPSPYEDKRKFVEFMLNLVKKGNYDLLIPVTDAVMIPILERRDEFEKFLKIAGPSYDVAMRAFDKSKTMRIATEAGIPCPKTYLANNEFELTEISKIIEYPAVIKPRSKLFWSNGQTAMLKVTSKNYAYNSADFLQKYKQLLAKTNNFGISYDFFIIQEYASGSGYGVELLMHNSEIKAAFMHRRLREYPINGGASTLRVSIQDKVLYNYAVKLLRAMQWEGVAMVEFKLDTSTGAINLMEVNGRFWGSLPLSITAGVDFPYLVYKCLNCENFNAPQYFLGVKQRWLIPGDFLWLYSSIVNGGEILKSIGEFISTPAISDDILSFSDPGPIVGALKTSADSFVNVVQGVSTISGETRKK